MVKEELKYQILQQFGFQPTSEQAHALEVFAQFLTDTTPHCAMILRGSAGTGKTSSGCHRTYFAGYPSEGHAFSSYG